MMTVNEGLVKKAVVTMEMPEYLELLQEATDGSEFIKVLKREIKVKVDDGGYVRMQTKQPGLSYYRNLIKTLVFMDLINNPETVEALYHRKEKYFNIEEMSFTEYKWYDDDTNNKINILSDDAVAEHWLNAMKIHGVLDCVLGMDADELGELCVKIQEYLDDEQIPELRKAHAKEVYDVLATDGSKVGYEDARWLADFGFVELPELTLDERDRK